ncbi:uncharacterized protein PV06_00014 [Exophiala oligosperma]|uniref:Uncharacterized protein n=1 Tax=Exophiala oligosperma TaxID=215243 RepID=A0A0D2DW28_9EURO|nr:uncharacterized protein PV06_00014 [Exophiala oligosperma]KIW47303.1 hypothetical protein PV06_00014 [Exophiala oligosperma]
MPLPSLRLLMGFTPRDLFPYDICFERAPCTEILTEQKIVILEHFRLVTDGPIHYSVKGQIYPFDGGTTFPNILGKLCSPDTFSYEMMHYLQKYLNKHQPWFNEPWSIKGGRTMDKEKPGGFLYQVSPMRGRCMFLLERHVPCNCHKLWKPKHELDIVPTQRYQEEVRKKKKQAQERLEAEKAAPNPAPQLRTSTHTFAMTSDSSTTAYSPAVGSEGWHGDYDNSGYDGCREREVKHLV